MSQRDAIQKIYARQRSASRQSGFSLIELMISIVIGSLVVLGATQMFMVNQRTFGLQQGLSDVQESGRFALDALITDVEHAGLDIVDASTTPPFCSAASGNIYGRPVCVSVVNGNDASTLPIVRSDQITVMYSPVRLSSAATAADCEGTVLSTLTTTGITSNFYYVATGTDNRATLFCDGIDANSAGTALIGGVESFQVLLGVESHPALVDADLTTWDDDGRRRPEQFKTAATLDANDVVMAVRLGLLVSSATPVRTGAQRTAGFSVLDQAFTPPQDGLLRRLFTSTVMINNLDTKSF